VFEFMSARSFTFLALQAVCVRALSHDSPKISTTSPKPYEHVSQRSLVTHTDGTARIELLRVLSQQ
jgi:hypothetical protein